MGDMTHDPALREIGKRVTSRLRVRLVAQVLTTRETLKAQLCDLSYFGARLLSERPPAPGCEVMIRWSGHEAFGMVVWSGADSFGLRFFDPVGPDVLIATRDTDDAENIRTHHDLTRREAQSFVQGVIRR